MREPEVILILVGSTLFSFSVSRRLSARINFYRLLRLLLILIAAFAMLEFRRIWVFPFCFGLLMGNLLAWEG